MGKLNGYNIDFLMNIPETFNSPMGKLNIVFLKIKKGEFYFFQFPYG